MSIEKFVLLAAASICDPSLRTDGCLCQVVSTVLLSKTHYERNMEANTTTKYSERDLGSRTAVGKAIDWLQSYVDKEPYTDAATEARGIIHELRAVRQRPGLDELLALIAQIAQTDQGLQQIDRAKIQMSQPEQKQGGKEQAKKYKQKER